MKWDMLWNQGALQSSSAGVEITAQPPAFRDKPGKHGKTRKTLMMSYLKGTPSNNPGRFSNQQFPRWPRCYHPWVTHTFFFLQNLRVPGFWQVYEQRQSWSHIMNINLSEPFSCRLSGNCATQMARYFKFSLLILNEFELVNFRNSPRWYSSHTPCILGFVFHQQDVKFIPPMTMKWIS